MCDFGIATRDKSERKQATTARCCKLTVDNEDDGKEGVDMCRERGSLEEQPQYE